jgi:hypothetical protein
VQQAQRREADKKSRAPAPSNGEVATMTPLDGVRAGAQARGDLAAIIRQAAEVAASHADRERLLRHAEVVEADADRLERQALH